METKKSFEERHPNINMLIGVGLLIAVIIGAAFALLWLGKGTISVVKQIVAMSSHLDAVVAVALVTGTVSLLTVIINSIVGKIIDYRKSRQDYLSKKRESTYKSFIDCFYKIINSTDGNNDNLTKDMKRDINTFSGDLMLWGSKGVVKKWVYYRNNATKVADPKSSLGALEDILNEMRKDMRVGKVEKWELVRIIVNDMDENGNIQM